MDRAMIDPALFTDKELKRSFTALARDIQAMFTPQDAPR
jgi:hypothetical protein